MPATNVPCPSRSLNGRRSPVKSTLCTTRAPKSAARRASTPESTIAIAGAEPLVAVGPLQSAVTSAACCQSPPEAIPAPRTLPFGVIERSDGLSASASSSGPLSRASAAGIDWKVWTTTPFAALMLAATSAVVAFACPSTITSNFCCGPGADAAARCNGGGTNAAACASAGASAAAASAKAVASVSRGVCIESRITTPSLCCSLGL